MRATTKVFGVFLLVLTIITWNILPASGASGVLTTAPEQAPSAPVAVNGNRVEVGDVVAQGILRADGGCDFGTITVETTAPGQGQTRWVNLHLDSQCRATVSAKWDGDFTHGPTQVVEPLQRLLGSAAPPVKAQGPQQSSLGVASTDAILSTKTSEQHVYMWGYQQGSWDQVTHKWGTLTFSWDGTNAWTDSQSGYCQGSNFSSWQWVSDGCWVTGTDNGPAWHVYRYGQGDYHCSPTGQAPCNGSDPDGYYHSLYDYENGYGNGASTCTYSYSGQILPGGVAHDILQGCS